MPDPGYAHPRLAPLYDPLDTDRSDLDAYAAIVAEFGARRVLDIGCGTGAFAVLLAARGVEVVGLDPAAASLDVARGKPAADRVRWIEGDASALPPDMHVDLAVMTGNVAQAIAGPADWDATLAAAHRALAPGGRLVFETRVPARRAWEEWTREHTHLVTDVPGVGTVTTWTEIVEVALPLVTFRAHYLFAADGAELISDSTLNFRERDEVSADLERHGFTVEDVREAPDRPGREWVFVARAVSGTAAR